MSDERDFAVRSEAQASGTTVVASGEIDLATSPQLRGALLDAPAGPVVLDLRQVTFLDSSGLGVIVAQNKRARTEGFRFAIVTAGAATVQRILELSGLTTVLDVVDDPAELLAG